MRASLSMGVPFHTGGSGHVGGGSYTGDLDECRWARLAVSDSVLGEIG